MKQQTTKQKAEALKGLLSGKLRPADVLPAQTVFIETYELESSPGILYSMDGKPVSKQDIDSKIEKVNSLGGIAWLENRTYSVAPNHNA